MSDKRCGVSDKSRGVGILGSGKNTNDYIKETYEAIGQTTLKKVVLIFSGPRLVYSDETL